MQHPRFKAASASLGHNAFIVGGTLKDIYGKVTGSGKTTEVIQDGVTFYQKNQRKATHGTNGWHKFGPTTPVPFDSHCMVNFQGIYLIKTIDLLNACFHEKLNLNVQKKM